MSPADCTEGLYNPPRKPVRPTERRPDCPSLESQLWFWAMCALIPINAVPCLPWPPGSSSLLGGPGPSGTHSLYYSHPRLSSSVHSPHFLMTLNYSIVGSFVCLPLLGGDGAQDKCSNDKCEIVGDTNEPGPPCLQPCSPASAFPNRPSLKPPHSRCLPPGLGGPCTLLPDCLAAHSLHHSGPSP